MGVGKFAILKNQNRPPSWKRYELGLRIRRTTNRKSQVLVGSNDLE